MPLDQSNDSYMGLTNDRVTVRSVSVQVQSTAYCEFKATRYTDMTTIMVDITERGHQIAGV